MHHTTIESHRLHPNKLDQLKVVVLIPTCNPGARWEMFLSALSAQSLRPMRCVVIDSESSDRTVQLAMQYEIAVHHITRQEFNHGATRQLGVDQFAGDADLVVFLTQDAILANPEALYELIAGFEESNVAAVYGRQLPNADATPVASHARLFNYPDAAHTYSSDDIAERGIKTCFLSNSFAAYRVKALQEVGGFPSSVILGEDMHLAARLILAGHSIRYVPLALVYHSHNYSLLAEFRRYFDIGVFHSQQAGLLKNFGGAGREGLKFLLSETSYLLRNAPWQLPEAFCRTWLKAIGYRLGLGYAQLTPGICRFLSMHKGYWT